jgi:hypothetical protein
MLFILHPSSIKPQPQPFLSDTIPGRGVFASKPIPSKTIIDVCPVLVVETEADLKHIEQTCLNHYT